MSGDDLWATHDGGRHWSRPDIPGLHSADLGPAPYPTDLEAAAGVVRLVFPGNPAFTIESSPVHTDDWTPSPSTLPHGAGPVPSGQIVLQGTSGWMVETNRVIGPGARLDKGAWVPWDPPCLQAGGPAELAASDSRHLVAVCDEGLIAGPSPRAVRTYFSSDGGTTFQLADRSLPPSSYGPIASPSPGVVIMVTTGSYGRDYDLIGTFNDGLTWKMVYRQRSAIAWAYIGFTTPNQGVALADDGTLLMTFDGGHHWAPMSF